ncbi:MAG: HAD-IIB family hydrolase [Polyangiaceae bacterium]
MLPLAQLAPKEARSLRGLLFDLDDTFLDHGRLHPTAYASLFEMREAGLELVAVTGRPALWAELVCRQWPLSGAIAENGNLAFAPIDGRVRRLDPVAGAERALRQQNLAKHCAELRRRFPDLVPTSDAVARGSDFTFDIGEYVQVAPERVREVMTAARQLGCCAERSSVHLHVTLDRHDKATGSLRFLREHFGVDPTLARHRYAYVGDSENDAPCFSAFHTTIGVRNLRGRPSMLPRFVTEGERSAGFVELARRLIQARSGQNQG